MFPFPILRIPVSVSIFSDFVIWCRLIIGADMSFIMFLILCRRFALGFAVTRNVSGIVWKSGNGSTSVWFHRHYYCSYVVLQSHFGMLICCLDLLLPRVLTNLLNCHQQQNSTKSIIFCSMWFVQGHLTNLSNKFVGILTNNSQQICSMSHILSFVRQQMSNK